MPHVEISRRRFFVIHNPLSGRNRRQHLDAVCARIAECGGQTEIASAGDEKSIRRLATRAAASGGFDALVVAGGDGTIRAAASEVIDTAVPLGVIPLGTGNVLAAELELPHGTDDLARMLMSGPTIDVSCGTVAAEPFLLMTSAGFDASVLPRLRHRTKRLLGKLAYAGPVLAQLAARQRTFTVHIDGAPYRCSWLVVSNVRHYAGSFVIAPDRTITAPGFTALAVTTSTRRGMLRVMAAIASGRPPPPALATVLPCRTVEIRDASGVPLQADGDPLVLSSLEIKADKRPLGVIVHPDCALLRTGGA